VRDTPVIIVHGYLAPRGLMLPMRHQLRAAGFPAYTVDLPFLNLASVKTCTERLKIGVEKVLSGSGQNRCDLVGVSLGGLMALHYIRSMGGADRVRRLVAVGTPFHGTWSALPAVMLFGAISPSAWECLPTSDFVEDLVRGPLPAGPEYFSIAGSCDPVAPASRCVLEGATNTVVPLLPQPFAHQALVLSPRVMEAIVGALGEPPSAPPAREDGR